MSDVHAWKTMLFLLGALAAGCRTVEATEIMLVVDSDLRSDSRAGDVEIDEVVIRIYRLLGASDADAGASRPDAGTADAGSRDAGDVGACSTEPLEYVAGGRRYEQRFECAYALGEHPLPIRLGVVPAGDASEPVLFEVSARLRGEDVVHAAAQTEFEENRLREVVVWLSAACRGVSCVEGTTCRLGRCVEVESECSLDPASCVREDAGPAMPPPASVIGGENSFNSCALRSDGALVCWGNGGASGETGAWSPPAVIPLEGIAGPDAVGLGVAWSCAIVAGDVRCWGRDWTTGSIRPPYLIEGVSGATAISMGSGHTCAVVAGGQVSCWGFNGNGQLGIGTVGEVDAPPAIVPGLSGVTSVRAGGAHTCALLSDGGARCWGYNGGGGLGDGTITQRTTPVAVVGLTGAVAIGVGGAFSCALLSSGEVRCWGVNTYGMLGDGTTTDRSVPVPVAGISGASALAVGAVHACALVSGSVWCWGDNEHGQLGDGTTIDRTAPVAVGLSGVVAIAAGTSHTCALGASGEIWCWGQNTSGQLGDGTRVDSAIPVRVLW